MAERAFAGSSTLDRSNAVARDGLDEEIQFPQPAIALPSYSTPSALGTGWQELSMGDRVVGGGTENFPSDLHMTDEIPHLVEVTTRGEPEYERYRRGYTHPAVYETYDIPALKTSFNAPPCPEGWQSFIHPEGMRYFFNASPDLPVPVLTEAWIYDEEIYGRLTEYMGQIYRYMERSGVVFPRPAPNDLPEDVHLYPQDLAPVVLVLEFKLSGNVGYYFVSHPTKALFWLDPFDFSEMLGEVHIRHTEWLVGLQMKSHYWTHNDYFPHVYELKHDDLEEAEDLLATAIGDAVTSSTATTGLYDLEQLKYLQILLQRYEQKPIERRRRIVGERRIICRLLDNFYRQRFLNLYGERGARLDSTQSIHYSTFRRQKFVGLTSQKQLATTWYQRVYYSVLGRRPSLDDSGSMTEDADPPIDQEVKEMHHESIWMRILSLLMFGTPGMHIGKLREITVDQIVSQQSLIKYSESMVEEWRDVALYGTVMMGADMSLLSIGSVDESSSDGKASSPQRAAYFSFLMSLASVILCMLLLRQHREAMSVTFIANRSNSRWGLESLALMYALPFALLVWSFVSFFVCFAILWYGSSDYALIAIVSAVLVGSLIAIAWVAQAQYEEDLYESYLTTAVEWVKRLIQRDRPYGSDSASTLTKSSRASSKRSVKEENVSRKQSKSGSATNVLATGFSSNSTAGFASMHLQKEGGTGSQV